MIKTLRLVLLSSILNVSCMDRMEVDDVQPWDVELFMSYEARYKNDQLRQAVFNGELDRIPFLIQQEGIPVDICIYKGMCRYTLLGYAVVQNRLSLVKILIENGASLTKAQYIPHEVTLLHIALCFGDNELLDYLIRNGAEVLIDNLGNMGGFGATVYVTPLMLANYLDRSYCVARLLHLGADSEAQYMASQAQSVALEKAIQDAKGVLFGTGLCKRSRVDSSDDDSRATKIRRYR